MCCSFVPYITSCAIKEYHDPVKLTITDAERLSRLPIGQD